MNTIFCSGAVGFVDGIKKWAIDFADEFTLNFIDDDRWTWIAKGLGNTLLITAGALVLGIVIGIFVAAVRSSFDKNREELKKRGGAGYIVMCILNAICMVYLTVIRGIPVVVQLLIWYFVILVSSNDGVPVAIIAFGVNSGAYVAEIFRSGIMSIDHGQFEAGRSLGFNYFQMMRFVVIPQAFKVVLPTLGNEFIALIKETAVVGYVGAVDITKSFQDQGSNSYEYMIPYLTMALLYIVIVAVIAGCIKLMERSLAKNERN